MINPPREQARIPEMVILKILAHEIVPKSIQTGTWWLRGRAKCSNKNPYNLFRSCGFESLHTLTIAVAKPTKFHCREHPTN